MLAILDYRRLNGGLPAGLTQRRDRRSGRERSGV
jgi:hypothetical protein